MVPGLKFSTGLADEHGTEHHTSFVATNSFMPIGPKESLLLLFRF